MNGEVEFTLEADEIRHRCVAVRRDLFFGHGLVVDIFKADGTPLSRIGFANHPDHAEHEWIQTLRTEDPIELARKRLCAQWSEAAMRPTLEAGLNLLLGFSDNPKARKRAR